MDGSVTLMFVSPFVSDLPRFTGGAVGYFGYGASTWFEPVLGQEHTHPEVVDEAQDRGQNFFGGTRVKGGCRLVENQDAWVGG